LMARSDRICPHLHICAQSGHDEMLKQMRRNYDTAYYHELLMRVRERLPDAALGSDIIVGFPGESDAHFASSLEWFTSLPLTYFHVFPYSQRYGTAAASLPNPVLPQEKKKRARQMRELGNAKKREFYQRFLGQRVSVLMEEKVDGKTGWQRGFSRNYLPVRVMGSSSLANQEVVVDIRDMQNGCLLGRVLWPRALHAGVANKTSATV